MTLLMKAKYRCINYCLFLQIIYIAIVYVYSVFYMESRNFILPNKKRPYIVIEKYQKSFLHNVPLYEHRATSVS